MPGEFARERGTQNFRDNEMRAICGATTARIFEKSREPESVIKGNFFARANVANGADFHASRRRIPNRLAIFRTRMIDETRWIVFGNARGVQKIFLVDFENKNRISSGTFRIAREHDFAGNNLAAILADKRPATNVRERENAVSVNGRTANFDQRKIAFWHNYSPFSE